MVPGNSFALLALAISLAGVIGLFAFSLLSEPTNLKISQLGNALNQRVSIEATVKGAFVAKNTLFLTLNDGSQVRAIIFSPSQEQRDIARKGNSVRVIGKVAEYKGELEIIVEKILSAEND